MAVLVTGVAGFIGSHVARHLLARGEMVVGIDNLNDYNPVRLKRDSLDAVVADGGTDRFALHLVDLADHADHSALAGAQAGVRYLLSNPCAYVASNFAEHVNILEVARERRADHTVYASSSSVCGTCRDLPVSVDARVEHPISLYAAIKKADEPMSETYAYLYRLPQTGLRFFTVNGPWGRPDMAVWGFTDRILSGVPIEVYNNGRMLRDFTFIDDIVAVILTAFDSPPPDDGTARAGGSVAPHRIYNIGNNRAEEVEMLIALIKEGCGRKAIRIDRPMRPGDVPAAYADLAAIRDDLGFRPTTPIAGGIPLWLEWYARYRASSLAATAFAGVG